MRDIQHVITSHWHSKFCDLWIYRFEWLINALSTVPCLKRGLGLCALFWEESSHMVLHIITLVGLALYPFSFVFAHFYSQSFCNEIWYHFPKSHGIKTVCIIIFFCVKYFHAYNTHDDKRRIVELELLCQYIITGLYCWARSMTSSPVWVLEDPLNMLPPKI